MSLLDWVILGIIEGQINRTVADAVYDVSGFDFTLDEMTWNCNENGCHNLPVKGSVLCFVHLPWPESVNYR